MIGLIFERNEGIMFERNKFNSRDIARQLIKNTGLDENLGILKQKNHAVAVAPIDYLKLVLSLSTTNLVQTMKADFIVKAVPAETQREIVQEYIQESFRQQEIHKVGKKEIEEAGLEVLKIVEELGKFWVESEDPQGTGPGPRYYCVKEILRRLGGAVNHDLQDALFELMYLQYRHYFKYFQMFLATQ